MKRSCRSRGHRIPMTGRSRSTENKQTWLTVETMHHTVDSTRTVTQTTVGMRRMKKKLNVQ